MRAPFRYWGSKVRMAPWIVDRLPEHDHFVEACAGSASVMAVKPPVQPGRYPAEVVEYEGRPTLAISIPEPS